MRTLLIASQKGGVGKTTTSINLAALAAAGGGRVLIVDADPLGSVADSLNLAPEEAKKTESPFVGRGRFWSDVLRGVDVVSPYETAQATDAELAEFLPRLEQLGDRYSIALIDAPPFLGQRPQLLLASAKELILVLRAEVMAYRSLPAFLQMVKEVQNRSACATLAGILLTLPSGEPLGSPLENACRRTFGDRVLSATIPYDSAVGESVLAGQAVVHFRPESAPAAQYRSLAAQLRLFEEPTPPPLDDGPAPTDAFQSVFVANPETTQPSRTKLEEPRASNPREDQSTRPPEGQEMKGSGSPLATAPQLLTVGFAPPNAGRSAWFFVLMFAVGIGLILAIWLRPWLSP